MPEDAPFVKYELPVVLHGGPPYTATLEVWASPEESPYVECSLQTDKSYGSMGFTPAVAAQLADALGQAILGAEGQFIADGFDDDDEAPVTLKASWGDGGVDLLMTIPQQGRVRIVMDDDEFAQVAQVIQALRECVATLVIDCTTRQELAVPAEAFNHDGLATLVATGTRYGGRWVINVLYGPAEESNIIGSVETAVTDSPDVAITTAKAWVDAECEHLGLKCVAYRNHNSGYGENERPYFTTAQIVVADKDWE